MHAKQLARSNRTKAPFWLQAQDDVSRLQLAVSNQLPEERQRRQQRLQGIQQVLGAPASTEVGTELAYFAGPEDMHSTLSSEVEASLAAASIHQQPVLHHQHWWFFPASVSCNAVFAALHVSCTCQETMCEILALFPIASSLMHQALHLSRCGKELNIWTQMALLLIAESSQPSGNKH